MNLPSIVPKKLCYKKLCVLSIRSGQATPLPTRTRLPITPEILRRIHQHWRERWGEWDIVLLWAVMISLFYGFLQAREVVLSSDTEFDPAQHLTCEDIAVDDIITVNIKQSNRFV